MTYELDHLVVAARTLEEGAAWVESALGVPTVAGGKHALMGTHNRLLALDARRYLEVIAVDPEAPPPSRPRWFGLDEPAMRERLAHGPLLLHWVARTADIEAELRDYPEPVEVLDLTRGEYAWRIGVPRDGRLPCGGACPTLIEWKGRLHPTDRLPPPGCGLLELRTEGPLRAVFSTPAGRRTLPPGE
ncbi:MAG TPA: VOC family protein [Usitatibacter sp.]|nr:VOC family protein [Usitatibacter sp.]